MKKQILLLLSLSLILTGCNIEKSTVYNSSNEDKEEINISEENDEINLDYTLAEEVVGLLEYKYLDFDETTEEELSYGLAAGVVDALGDPYSEFLNPEDTRELENSLSGNLMGIGAELTKEYGLVIIVSPLRGSPAEKAGLEPGDIIIEVDETSIENMSLWEVVQMIRGEPDTEVTLSVWRESEEETLEITITRAEIHVPSVELEWVGENENYAHIIINSFDEKTSEEFFEKLKEALDKDTKGIILDMRYNGGGYLDDSIEVASVFLKVNQEVVEVRGKGDDITKNRAVVVPYHTDLPTVVLVNSGSASASEIVAGALKDHNRAKVVGTQTFGKGTVQELIILSDGSSLRVTIAKWYTPGGTSIDHEGITPQVEVENEDKEIDSQLNKAIEILDKSEK